MNSSLVPHLTVAELAARAELACATTVMCEVHRATLRAAYQSDATAGLAPGAFTELSKQVDELGAFLTAWHRGPSGIESMRVIETAVRGFAEWFDVDATTKEGIARLSLDFMRKLVRRLPVPGRAEDSERDGRVHRAQDRLEGALDSLLAAYRRDGGDAGSMGSHDALRALATAALAVVEQGHDEERLMAELDWWTTAVGLPRLEVIMEPEVA